MKTGIDELARFCKRKGFVFPTSEIYGGLQGFYDYGPLGVEIKNNIKQLFWNDFVTNNELIIGIEGSIKTHPRVWVASQHVNKFLDIMVRCSSCGNTLKAETLIEAKTGIDIEGKSVSDIKEILKKHKLKCPKCNSLLTEVEEFRLMFETSIGPFKDENSKVYLRPETAQLIFADFRSVFQTSRLKLPFGIAQIGKAFRNEISPRNFLFRLREFEQFEIEFLVNPEKLNECPLYEKIKNKKINLADDNKQGYKALKIGELLKRKIFASKWHGYWLYSFFEWFKKYGISEKNLRLKPHTKEQLAHYAKACIDIEYRFPFGWKELHGNADRGLFDLSQHEKASKEKLSIYDEATSKKVLPYVAAEPSQGIERAMLAFLFEAYNFDKKRGYVVLKLHPKIVPVQVAVCPLVKKDGLPEKAKDVYAGIKGCFRCFYDESGSIGRRYARQDEIGTPYIVTIDYDTLKDNTVTIRDRNTTYQQRVKIEELNNKLWELINA